MFNRPILLPILSIIILLLVITSFFIGTTLVSGATNVSHWQFEELNSTDPVVDIISGNNGTNFNATVGISGQVGNSFLFNGTSSKVTIPTTGSMAGDIYSISAWIYPNGWIITDQNDVFDRWTGSQTRGFTAGHQSNGEMYIDVGKGSCKANQSYTLTGHIPPLNQWTHEVWTVNGSTREIKFYQNGLLEATFSFGHSICNNNGIMISIGARGNESQWWNGRIDEPQYFLGELTDSEVLNLFNGGGLLPPTPTPTPTLIPPTPTPTPIPPSNNGRDGDFLDAGCLTHMLPSLSLTNRLICLQLLEDRNYDVVYIYPFNENDYGGPAFDYYGVRVGSNTPTEFRVFLQEINDYSFCPVVWLFPDDSPIIDNEPITNLQLWLDGFIPVVDDLVCGYVTGLENNEYWTQAENNTIGFHLETLTTKEIGNHQTAGLWNRCNSTWCDVQYLQYGFNKTEAEITLLTQQAIADLGKPMIAAEYCQALNPPDSCWNLGLAAINAGAIGAGNGILSSPPLLGSNVCKHQGNVIVDGYKGGVCPGIGIIQGNIQ